MRPIRDLVGLLVLLGSLVGCAEELGPVPMPVATVRGRVTQGVIPVSGGWLEFSPVQGTIGKLRSARIGEDGTFVAEGVAVGLNQVRLVDARAGGKPYRGIFSQSFSTIRREVRPDADAPIAIDLVIEYALFQKRFGQMGGEKR